jgi:hypothetical protein
MALHKDFKFWRPFYIYIYIHIYTFLQAGLSSSQSLRNILFASPFSDTICVFLLKWEIMFHSVITSLPEYLGSRFLRNVSTYEASYTTSLLRRSVVTKWIGVYMFSRHPASNCYSILSRGACNSWRRHVGRAGGSDAWSPTCRTGRPLHATHTCQQSDQTYPSLRTAVFIPFLTVFWIWVPLEVKVFSKHHVTTDTLLIESTFLQTLGW